MGQRSLLFVVNEPHFFISHRLPLALGACAAGYEVHVATRAGDSVERLRELGLRHHALPLSRSGRNPLVELASLWALFSLMRRLRPDVVHLVTIKPVLYGGIAARLARVPGVVAAVSGLGFVFTNTGSRAALLRGIVARLYRVALGHPNLRVVFQNSMDRAVLVQLEAVTDTRAVIVPGSGVDLREYLAVAEPPGRPVVVMAVRLLREKGVAEFIEAARQLRSAGVTARFLLAGSPDSGNPSSVTAAELNAWRSEGSVELAGHCSDVAALFAGAHLVVLPSYYGEGLPKVLVEAAACGRAVVTTDSPGCRDAIEPGVTGLLVPPRDATSLAASIRRLLDDTELRRSMGRAGRALAERRYGIDQIVAVHLRLYDELSSLQAR